MKEIDENIISAKTSDKQHREFLAAIKELVSVIKKYNEQGDKLFGVVTENGQKINVSLSKIQDSIKFEYPEQDDTVMREIKEILVAVRDNLVKEEIKEEPSQWEFKVKRNINGFIDSVIAKQIWQ